MLFGLLDKSLDMVKEFPLVTTLNLGRLSSIVYTKKKMVIFTLYIGGGFKVARMPTDKGTVLSEIGIPVKEVILSPN